jgi:hypothetical protein
MDNMKSVQDWSDEIKTLTKCLSEGYRLYFSEKNKELLKQHIDLNRKKIQIARS